MQSEMLEAVRVLRCGGLVAMPTETVYGLAANAFDALAVARIFEVKRRPRFDPLIVHVARYEDLTLVAESIPDQAVQLARRFWPGPLTLVLPRTSIVPDLVTSGLPTVAVRIPDHPVALALIRTAGFPLAAPSANPFGFLSPTTAGHVRDMLGGAVDYVLDGGACRVGVESTIVGWRGGTPVLLRAGGLAVEEIERQIGPLEHPLPDERISRPEAPGQLPQHYAPRTPLELVDPDAIPAFSGRVGWIGLKPPPQPANFSFIEVLSVSGDLREAAATLFAALHRLDQQQLDRIYAATVPARGLGLAINDRLRRAATRS